MPPRDGVISAIQPYYLSGSTRSNFVPQGTSDNVWDNLVVTTGGSLILVSVGGDQECSPPKAKDYPAPNGNDAEAEKLCTRSSQACHYPPPEPSSLALSRADSSDLSLHLGRPLPLLLVCPSHACSFIPGNFWSPLCFSWAQ